jgi:serine protease inhibitor
VSNSLETLPIVIFGLLLGLGAVGSAGAQDVPSIESAMNQFGLDLFHEVRAQVGGEPNVIVSPVSAALALGMVHLGADGATERAMKATLHLPAVDREELVSAYRRLLDQLNGTDSAVALDLANSIWLNWRHQFNSDYLSQVTECFAAELARVDFSDPASADVINNWVSDATQGKIDRIVDAVEPDLAMILINALYFKADWQVTFDTSLTRPQPFRLPDGSTVDHPLMQVSERFRYLETPELQMIELPYAGQQHSMFIILPADTVTIANFLDQLTFAAWNEYVNKLIPQRGTLVLPRFKLTSDYILNRALQNLGMETAFVPGRADFSPMLADPGDSPSPELFISEVRQKTFIEVIETGTEAAAVTSVGIRLTSIQQDEPKKFFMHVDRPFAFVLTDKGTGTLLFIGQVGDPAR